MRRLAFTALLGAAAFAAGPGSHPVRADAGQKTLAVAAAANLEPSATELAAAFEATRPGTRVAFTFGASGALSSQLANGAPYDLFLSADRDYPGRLLAAGLAAEGDERVYAFGKLVAWLPPGSTLALDGRLAALASPEVKRIAIANPAVAPFGRAAVAAFTAAGLAQTVEPKLVRGASAGQAAQFASTGAADVALLPLALTFQEALARGRVVAVDEALYPRIEQSAVVLSGAREPELARAFLAFILGGKGRAILARYGYGLP